MSEYTRNSLEKKLEEEVPKVRRFLKGRTATPELIKEYYGSIGARVNRNALDKLVKHFRQ